MDEEETPQREIERQKEEGDKDRAEQVKARGLNKPNFRPCTIRQPQARHNAQGKCCQQIQPGGPLRGRHSMEERMASKLFVGNLPHSVSDTQLNEFVIAAGFQVASAVVIRDKLTGTPRGFGFVELAEGEDMQKAITGLNGQSLEGRPLTVNEAKPQRTGFGRSQGGRGRDSYGSSGRGGRY